MQKRAGPHMTQSSYSALMNIVIILKTSVSQPTIAM